MEIQLIETVAKLGRRGRLCKGMDGEYMYVSKQPMTVRKDLPNRSSRPNKSTHVGRSARLFQKLQKIGTTRIADKRPGDRKSGELFDVLCGPHMIVEKGRANNAEALVMVCSQIARNAVSFELSTADDRPRYR
jgi:hypothetical protein